MDSALLSAINQQNPWLRAGTHCVVQDQHYIPRVQLDFLMKRDWDALWTVLVGPRQSGKTTLGKHLCQQLLSEKRYERLLYLNCDYREIRQWLNSPPHFLEEIEQILPLKNAIVFIDEVQRLEMPGLLLKIMADLRLPVKLIASGSSQLEIKSKVQEHLTGRQLEVMVLPLSCREVSFAEQHHALLCYGSYPQVYLAKQKQVVLQELFTSYIQKDIIEFLQVRQPDVMQQLLGLLAHSSGQLIHFQQLAVDCRINVATVKHYMDILERTYVIKTIKPFVGHKRTELTSNPICYFLDNGFRNQALNNFTAIDNRTDNGLLVQNMVFQELYKYHTQERKTGSLYYWRTKAGAEVDFVLKTGFDTVLPIEVKYRNTTAMTLTRGFKSFLDAYQPKEGAVITKNHSGLLDYHGTRIYFIPLAALPCLFLKLSAPH